MGLADNKIKLWKRSLSDSICLICATVKALSALREDKNKNAWTIIAYTQATKKINNSETKLRVQIMVYNRSQEVFLALSTGIICLSKNVRGQHILLTTGSSTLWIWCLVDVGNSSLELWCNRWLSSTYMTIHKWFICNFILSQKKRNQYEFQAHYSHYFNNHWLIGSNKKTYKNKISANCGLRTKTILVKFRPPSTRPEFKEDGWIWCSDSIENLSLDKIKMWSEECKAIPILVYLCIDADFFVQATQ